MRYVGVLAARVKFLRLVDEWQKKNPVKPRVKQEDIRRRKVMRRA